MGDVEQVHTWLRRVARREIVLLLGRMAARAAGMGLFVLVALGSAALGGWSRGETLGWSLLLLGSLAWLFVGRVVQRHLQEGSDPLRQARRVEALLPQLRGALLTLATPAGGVSPATDPFLARMARRLRPELATLSPARVHPAGGMAAEGALVGLAALVVLVTGVVTGARPSLVAAYWLGERSALNAAAVAPTAVGAAAPLAVGDITLHLVYPAHTGLDPKTIPNARGDVEGPPGTQVEVRLRTAEAVDGAGLVAYGQRSEAAVDGDGRSVTTRFTVGEIEGQWRLELLQEGGERPTPDFAITPVPDLPPDVRLLSEVDLVTLAVDEVLELAWSAQDDFGLDRVQLQIDGQEERRLWSPKARVAHAEGAPTFTPKELGLSPGAEVELRVVAWDNDAWAGSKSGQSRGLRLVVVGPRGMEDRAAKLQGELIEVLGPLLARLLTEELADTPTSLEVAQWGERLSVHYEPLPPLLERLPAGDRRLAVSAMEAGQALLRYSQVAFAAEGAVRAPRANLEALWDLHGSAVRAVEDALLSLLRHRQNRALATLLEQTGLAEDLAREIQAQLQQGEIDAVTARARLEQMERLLEALAETRQDLAEGGLRDQVEGRERELAALMEEAGAELDAGQPDAARRLLSRGAAQLSELRGMVEDNLRQQQSESEDQQAQAQALLEELKDLESAQRALAKTAGELRQQDAPGAGAAAALWARAEALTQEALDAAQPLEGSDALRGFALRQAVGQATEDLGRLLESIRRRDRVGALERAAAAADGWDLARTFGAPSRAVSMVSGRVREVQQILDQLAGGQGVPPGAQEEIDRLTNEQARLEERLQAAEQQAVELLQEFPVEPPDLLDNLATSSQRMAEGRAAAGQGSLLDAEGAQSAAADHLGEAWRALQEAMEEAARQAQQLSSGGGEGEQEGAQGGQAGEEAGEGQDQAGGSERAQGQEPAEGETSAGGGAVGRGRQMEIPGRDEFQTPEAYRAELLRGMEGDVPEEYRSLKRRYYEELVNR